MMSLVMRKQIYTVVGCMLSKFRAWFIIKIWTIKYYIQNPSMFYKTIKGRADRMIDKEYDEFDWKLVFSWSLLAVFGGLWWWSVFLNGFFVTMLWTIVCIAIYGLYATLGDLRK